MDGLGGQVYEPGLGTPCCYMLNLIKRCHERDQSLGVFTCVRLHTVHNNVEEGIIVCVCCVCTCIQYIITYKKTPLYVCAHVYMCVLAYSTSKRTRRHHDLAGGWQTGVPRWPPGYPSRPNHLSVWSHPPPLS